MNRSMVLLDAPADLSDARLAALVAAFPATRVRSVAEPVASREVEGAALFSLAAFRPDAGIPRPHAAHLDLQTEPSPGGPLRAAQDHVHAVAAYVSAAGAVAVYDAQSPATHPAAFYVEAACASERPVVLWTGLSLAEEGPGRMSALSLGIRRRFGLPDLMVNGRSSEVVVAFLFDLVDYTVRTGQALPEGHTVGRTEAERARVVYEPSPIDPAATIARVDL